MQDKNLKMPDMSGDAAELAENMQRVQGLSMRLIRAMAEREATQPKLEAPSVDLYFQAVNSWVAGMVANPEKLVEQQTSLWRETMKNMMSAQQQAMAGMTSNSGADEVVPPRHPDRRFSNPLWNSNPWLHFVRDQYLTTSRAMAEVLSSLDDLAETDRKRIEFFGQQIADMVSPNNFFNTNPDAMQKAMETNGKSLVDGLENFVRDVEANEGRLAVTLSDPSAFELGKNIATAPGKVVYRNRLFELIQYAPETKKVFATPLVILPPWINKYYILDLKPANSFIRFAVAQGFTVFVVSWVNPDANYAETGFDDYVHDGAIEAINKVCEITGEKQVNAIGYCIGGTLLATALATLAKGGHNSVANATFFTTLLDFEAPGEITAFLNDAMLEGLEEEVEKTGYLSAFFMARTFSYMRANDLVYGPAIKSYMLGEAPPAFDLLYWNGDSTNLPAEMARQYLKRLYKNNELMNGDFSVGDVSVSLNDIDIPIMAVATRTDHIAPWKASFSGMEQMSGDRTLILSDSGHIAGIVNPPEAKKYGYWTNNDAFDPSLADEWFHAADRHEGSWWPVWTEWMSERSGKKTAAREPGSKEFPALADAPGDYVKAKA